MFYDPLIGKLVVHGGGPADNAACAASAVRGPVHIEGLKTNLAAHVADPRRRTVHLGCCTTRRCSGSRVRGSMAGEVRYEVRGAAAWVTIDREEQRNALSPEVVTGLREAVDRVG